ncbi:MAG: hypothetical protein A3K19_02080 [Lentisphaerae bacterium RIFOXYB12_FULL_65_16]|nr:MAG: hypothetical protein A3K18_25300 [Lentisphaerae bacterium RIFOXYA12_64_32]OGV92587.1 MAG: hypothetical protein A3K19_02080 [Lentisphaerae bacterium RIFOXYB12_FULL_65_16]
MPPRKKLKFIGCEIIYREACALAARTPHMVDLEFLRKGLHDLKTADMLAKIQEAVDAVDPEAGYDAILLGYARCNNGIVGLTARSIPLVVPRAHDCITFFFGSRPAYREYFDAHPGTYYMTTGWKERNRSGTDYDRPAYGQQGVMGALGLAESYEDMVEKYGKENADFVVETMGGWLKNYSKFLYLKMGVCDETEFIEATHAEARERNWDFEVRDGDWTLMDKLFHARWDDDFIIVQPGQRITARTDEGVLDVQ